jgi:hypothetical protein
MTDIKIEGKAVSISRDNMKFIKYDKMKNENLDWGELIEPNEHADFCHHEILDRAGEIYIGVVYDDGAVETAYAMWDSVDTFVRFQVRPVMYHYSGRVTRTLHWNQDTDELFCERTHRNSSDTSIYRVTGAELLEWFLTVGEEDDVIELPQMGDACVSPPAKPRQQIEGLVAAEFPSLEDWVIKRLSETALAQAADSKELVRGLVKHIKSRPSPPGE